MSKPVTVRLDENMRKRLEAVAKADDRSSHYVIKKAVEAYVENAERVIEERRITMERLDHYELTGEYVTEAAVGEWVSSLSKQKDVA